MQLSKNLTLKEVTKSQQAIRLGIDNTPSEEHLQALKDIATNVFQPLRDWHNAPITISSGYRSPLVNKAIGGAENSQHSKGQALDLDTNSDNAKIFNYIKEHLPFDQLIWEFGDENNPDWVHVSFNKLWNRRQVLKAVRVNGKTFYNELT